MNCKPGDLAVIVGTKSKAGEKVIGLFVHCVEYRPAPNGEPAWIIDLEVMPSFIDGGVFRLGNWLYDSSLRPIRDQDGEDEMIRIAGKPKAKERA